MAIPLSSLSIFPASPGQIYESRKRTFVQWGRGISLEAYLRRDARIDNHEAAKDGRLVTWILAQRETHTPGSMDFFCSCETYRRGGLLVNRQEGDNTHQEIYCYGVASVFTPAEHRKKGYASHMMRLLHWILAPKSTLPTNKFPSEWGTPPERPSNIYDAAFSVLYSDVGANFYAICGPSVDPNGGWLLTEPTSTTWSVNTAPEKDALSVAKETGKLEWKWLDESSTYQIWEADAQLIAEEFKTPATDKHVEVTFLPHKGVAGFQHHRLEYFWEKLDPFPKYWSICAVSGTGDGGLAPTTFASWTLDTRPPDENALIITRLRVKPEDFLELLDQVMGYARLYKVERMEVWGLPQELRELAASIGGKTFTREEHLSSFKWYGQQNLEDVAWIHNEKFCWC